MAQQDVNKGFGNLSSWLTSWFCPKCKSQHLVSEWAITMQTLGAETIIGRKCPNCDFIAAQVGDTEQMLQADEKTVELIQRRLSGEAERAEQSRNKLKEKAGGNK